MKFKWSRSGSDWVSTTGWRIEKVFSPAPKGYGWYVCEPIDGGYYDSLAEAKADCVRATERALIETAMEDERV